ncbi:MAG: glutamate-1-semialdehyde 2,1-aminomutase [Deltaproteobacteria bacterium]|nr:glutamate-1-semialdehyde 2,1-aminomutase [Deltaproteobacteria bacterium]
MEKWQPGNISREIFNEACKVIPGGVNSPVRAFQSVNLEPFIVDRAKGPFVYDVDGNCYTDFICSWGPMILGHGDSDVEDAAIAAIKKGTSFGASHKDETTLARLIKSRFPSIEKVRLVSSGTEATMSAVRLARGFTGKNKIVKFDGCYHGHSDSFLINAGSGAATLGVPSSSGVTKAVAEDTLSAVYNDLEGVENLFEKFDGEIAAVIIEPVAGNMGCVLPKENFLQGLRTLCDNYGVLLIFDEVITGFRIAKGGAFERFNVKADLTTLGKVAGGGMPVGAFGGRGDIMDFIAPAGSVYQAGTLSGNPVAVACGIATINKLTDNLYTELEKNGACLEQILKETADEAGVKISINRMGSIIGLFFSDEKILNYDDVKKSDSSKFNIFFETLLKNGVSIAPSPFEVMFVSSVHTKEILNNCKPAFLKAFKAVKEV